MTATTHDAAVAGTSHLPLVLAAAHVEAVVGSSRSGDPGGDPERPFDPALTAGGWRDMTRLARGDVAMGAGIAATNADALAARIRDLRAVLDAWLAELEGPGGPDEPAIAARLEAARSRLEGLG
jgi:prephenate dehydrogenase